MQREEKKNQILHVDQTRLSFRMVSFAAFAIGIIYLVARIDDLHTFYLFADKRHHAESGVFHQYAPFLFFGLDLIFVLEQGFFSFINWKMRFPVRGFSEVSAGEVLPQLDPIRISVLIPSWNEPRDVIEATLNAACAIDYPQDRFEVLFLDDQGETERRTWVETLALNHPQCRLRYLTRVQVVHAAREHRDFKAGNLNFGISQANPAADAFLILDADHVCLPSILRNLTSYWLGKDGEPDGNFGFVQAPQTYQADEFDAWDRPCREFHRVTQAYRAHWDATMLTGTGTLIGAKALRAVGLFDSQTVTEDIVTGAKIQAMHFSTHYHPDPVAYGWVPETLPGMLRQRKRWAQGSFQMLKHWKKFTHGLSWVQKLTYASGIIHFGMSFPYLLLSLLPIFVLGLHVDTSLHYSTVSILLLGLFFLTRYQSREIYCPKKRIERAANNFLWLVYSPVYVHAFFSAFLYRKLDFQITLKSKEIKNKPWRGLEVPLAIGAGNLFFSVRTLLQARACQYPLRNFIMDDSGLIALSVYFFSCSVIPIWISTRAKS